MSRHPGIRGGLGSGRRGRPSKAEEIEAETRCECGVLVDRHPPLAKPRPWGYGRPCSRGRDGEPAPSHGPGIRVVETRR